MQSASKSSVTTAWLRQSPEAKKQQVDAALEYAVEATLAVRPKKPLLLVAQDLIGLCRFLEAGLGIGVVGVLVGVVLDGQLPIGLLDVGIGCTPVDTEDLVEIALGHGSD